MKRLRLSPKGRLRRNVAALLLLFLTVLLIRRPAFTFPQAVEQIQELYHLGPVAAAQWYPEEQYCVLLYDRWYAVCPLERGRFYFWDTWEPENLSLVAAPVEDTPLSVCGLYSTDIIFGLCSDPTIETVRITYKGGGDTHTAEVSPGEGGLFLYHCPEGLPEYELYTAQALDGRGQVLCTVTRSAISRIGLI